MINNKKKFLENKILIKNFHLLNKDSACITGKIPKNLLYLKYFKKYIIYSFQYDIYQYLKKKSYKNIFFNEFLKKKKIYEVKNLIFYWSKNKKEVIFQMNYFFSILSRNCKITVIGKKKVV